jgi:hypothetical protein
MRVCDGSDRSNEEEIHDLGIEGAVLRGVQLRGRVPVRVLEPAHGGRLHFPRRGGTSTKASSTAQVSTA